ncbi:MAG: Uma2 family endonuclease [Anaerolineae bacterium]|nr:Uma2 family endonuclease [Anaerolineae bacterium]
MSEVRKELLEKLKAPGVLDDELRLQLLEVLLTPSRPRRMSYEEFLEWCDEDTWAEWVNGEVVVLSPASEQHQHIRAFLEAVLGIYAQEHGLGRVIGAPFLMRLPEEMRRAREPDLLFVAGEHLARLKETYLDGPADLVVEIVSPESLSRDRGEKFYEYEQAGIPEYWLIDPRREEAEFYQLDAQGRYRLVLSDAEGVYHSRVLGGFRLHVAWLWRPPRVLDALRELGLV